MNLDSLPRPTGAVPTKSDLRRADRNINPAGVLPSRDPDALAVNGA